MRKNYISTEYNYTTLSGVNNKGVEDSIFINTIPNLPQYINIFDDDIIYYQNTNAEQLTSDDNFNTNPIMVNTVELKRNNTNIVKKSNGSFEVIIDLNNIYVEYVFSIVKKHKMFINLTKDKCLNGDVNITIRNYCIYNILNNYVLDNIYMYIKYNKLTDLNEYKDNFRINNIKSENNKFLNYTKRIYNNQLIIEFKPIKNIEEYNFELYYDLVLQNINR